MSDIEFDSENISPLLKHEIIDVELNSSNVTHEKVRAKEIEQLLKISTDPKQYVVKKNFSQFIKSDVWKLFGFPSKLQTNGKYQVISGFVSCFNCFKTLPYDGSTKYMIKHKCSNINSSNTSEDISAQETIDKYMKKKVSIPKNDKDKFKDKLVSWTCSSIRPFTIVEDPGFIDIVKESISLGELKVEFE